MKAALGPTRDMGNRMESEAIQQEIVECLARAGEYRDDQTGDHTRRVGRMSGLIARRLGLPEDEVRLIELASMLHDIGKIGIPDSILLKPGPLEPDEAEVMARHTDIGGDILGGCRAPLLRLARSIATSHHDRYDGVGNRSGQKGEAIPLAGRIVAVADTFDALIHERPYKKAWTFGKAVAYVEGESGAKFDPKVVAAFLEVVREDYVPFSGNGRGLVTVRQHKLDFAPTQAEDG